MSRDIILQDKQQIYTAMRTKEMKQISHTHTLVLKTKTFLHLYRWDWSGIGIRTVGYRKKYTHF